MSITFTTKKALGAVLAAALLSGTAIVSIAPAQAASVKQGAACSVAGAKSKSGATTYTCGTNPVTPTSMKLVWLTSNCINQGSTFKVAQSANTTSAGVLSQLQTAIAANQSELTNAQTALAAANAKQYFISTDQTTKTKIYATGLAAAITALQAKLTADQAAYAAATALADKTAWQTAITQRSGLIQVLTHEQSILNTSVTNAQTNLTTLNSQLTTLTGPGGGSATAKATLATATKSLAVACKAGL